jgi:hypothetical protein
MKLNNRELDALFELMMETDEDIFAVNTAFMFLFIG